MGTDAFMEPQVLAVGVGNEYRGDDGIGLVIIRALKAKKLPALICLENNGDGTILMETWNAASSVILIDVVSSGAPPGTIYRFDALAQPLPADYSFPSTHAFGVAEAIRMAQALHQLPAKLVIYGIEGKNFNAGTVLSPEVSAAGQEVVARVMQEISCCAG